jgi:hypothetical protein
MKRSFFAPALLGCLLLSAPAARATDVRLGADVGWARDASFDAFWENDLFSRLDVGLAYTVLAAGPLRLDVELGYGYAGYLEATSSFDGMTSSLTVHDVFAGVRASYAPADASWVRPYVHVQGGAAIGLAAFRDASAPDAPSFEDGDVGGLVYGGGGVEFVLPLDVFMDEPPEPISEPLAFGLYLEGGYFYRTPFAFSPSTPSGGDDSIPIRGFTAGDVDLSGGELRLGFVARL